LFCCIDPVGNCSELLGRCLELHSLTRFPWPVHSGSMFRVVEAMFGVAFLDPFSLICAFRIYVPSCWGDVWSCIPWSVFLDLCIWLFGDAHFSCWKCMPWSVFLDLLYWSCWELSRVVGAMFGVAFLDPFSLICTFDCLEMHTFRVAFLDPFSLICAFECLEMHTFRVGNACLVLLYWSCWELFQVVGAMFGVAFLDPFSLICAFDCLEMHTFRVGNACLDLLCRSCARVGNLYSLICCADPARVSNCAELCS
jgi:hypothetical protein